MARTREWVSPQEEGRPDATTWVIRQLPLPEWGYLADVSFKTQGEFPTAVTLQILRLGLESARGPKVEGISWDPVEIDLGIEKGKALSQETMERLVGVDGVYPLAQCGELISQLTMRIGEVNKLWGPFGEETSRGD